MTLPRDFLEELETELDAARRHVAQDRARIVALEELHAVALVLAATLRRPITVLDVLHAAGETRDRARLRELVRLLRRPVA